MTAPSPRPTGSILGAGNIMLFFLLGVLALLSAGGCCSGGGGGGTSSDLESFGYCVIYCSGVPMMDGTGGG